jgi:hypothetical protein
MQVPDSVLASPSGGAKEKEFDMRRKLTWVILSAAMMVTVLYTGKALATPPLGFVGTTIAMGRFGEFDVFNKLIPHGGAGDVWLSLQKTKGLSDAYVQSNVWQPGGSTGWHSHPGHSLIVVTSGTIKAYEGDDPGCNATVYTPGMGFVDPGGDHVHNLRNEGAVTASTITFQLIPAGATRRIDAPSPGNCPF